MREPWIEEFRHAYRTVDDLLNAGLISPGRAAELEPVLSRYQFILPRYYAQLIDKTDPECPIRRQALPNVDEMETPPTWEADPLDDLNHRPAPHITHRYRNRALLHLTPNCSMYCRYCFRKSLLNELSGDFFQGSLHQAFEYLRTHPEIEEVILSGGDPLMVSNTALAQTVERLSAIASLTTLRIHTRVPVTFPERITANLLEALCRFPRRRVLVTHFNHPREITVQSQAACEALRPHLTLLNQSVLLKGVNDEPETLIRLSRELFRIGVLPYYLHHPDRSRGTSHFDVSPERGMQLYRKLKAGLSGYLVPRYVVDEAGIPYKRDVWDQSSVPV